MTEDGDTGTSTFLDGNALAGPLSAVFRLDVTAAVLTCVGCGRPGRLAELRVYGAGPGVVARCPGCDQVVLRYAITPAGHWVDLTGAVTVHIPSAPGERG
jgi:hypothetical protein